MLGVAAGSTPKLTARQRPTVCERDRLTCARAQRPLLLMVLVGMIVVAANHRWLQSRQVLDARRLQPVTLPVEHVRVWPSWGPLEVPPLLVKPRGLRRFCL